MTSKAPLGLSYNETARAIVEFLEVAIHTILYTRQIYPLEIFTRRKIYDTPVWRSRHPELNEYIGGVVKAVGEEIILGTVEKVVVVIKDKKGIALERFIFSIKQMVELESYDRDQRISKAMSAKSLSQYFRAFLVKLNMLESQLGPIMDDEPSFTIVLELASNKVPLASAQKGDPPPWIPASKQHTTIGQSSTSSADGDSEIHFVRAVDTGVINLSLAVQESREKIERMNDSLGANAKGKARS
ncbi:hypothetical protein M422DRAFT_275248 [Sphaerobolus stellatus SS14]|uniref:HORMA domain-containing protein n=1 Tax=Sphaerobolus stellatus (strain SS14) TaxID=990650 RepID=A0A0C9T5C3_SPHS4|nr:hypothetical protein M422DRAFT_275248 [Sphaerobolus stellatus SS14]